MWIEKLTDGVVELSSPIGSRYVRPNLLQRTYLIWMFRNFFCLPQQVLLSWESRLVDHLWNKNKFVSLSVAGSSDRPVIGKIERKTEPTIENRVERKLERRAPVQAEVVSIRKPVAASKSAVTDTKREAASA